MVNRDARSGEVALEPRIVSNLLNRTECKRPLVHDRSVISAMGFRGLVDAEFGWLRAHAYRLEAIADYGLLGFAATLMRFRPVSP